LLAVLPPAVFVRLFATPPHILVIGIDFCPYCR